MLSATEEVAGNGTIASAISDAMVGMLHRYTGRGPTKARTTISRDLIVCVLGATLTKGEQSLVKGGRQEDVLHGRRAFEDIMRADAIAVVQELSGRRVAAFMSHNHIDPDLAVEIFVLEPRARQVTEQADAAHDGPFSLSGRQRDPLASGELDR
jgi:uncharacterized protein YbcI